MAGGFVVLLALLAAATARPDPQIIYGADPIYGALPAYTAPVVAPVVPAAVSPALPVSSVYPELAPPSISTYSYGYQSNVIGEVPSANLIYPYSTVPYANLRYSSLSYPSVPFQSLPYTYLSYRR